MLAGLGWWTRAHVIEDLERLVYVDGRRPVVLCAEAGDDPMAILRPLGIRTGRRIGIRHDLAI